MSAPKLAIESVVLLRLAGNYNTPTWTELEIVRDVQVDPAWDQAEAFSRETDVKEYAKGLLELGFTIDVKSSDTDAGYIEMMDAFASKSAVIDMLILDGSQTTNGAEGVRFDAGVFGASQDQSIGGVLYRSFEVKPSAYRTNKAKRAVVTNSAPVFSDWG